MLTAASSAGTLRSVRPLNVSNDTQAHTTRSIALNTYSSKPQSLRPAWFGVYRPATLLARQCSPTGWKPGSLERKATGGRCTISSAAIAGETTDGAAKEQKWKSVKKVFITVGGKGVTSKHCNSLKELLKSHGLVKVKLSHSALDREAALNTFLDTEGVAHVMTKQRTMLFEKQ
mmetsp:Transcript_42733/g.51883  ORF Transcript_42733/g.51883 Transcript_42733/m.51883 type:complete len:174 (+) Transcript_42733:183-704(+)